MFFCEKKTFIHQSVLSVLRAGVSICILCGTGVWCVVYVAWCVFLCGVRVVCVALYIV